MVTLNSTFLYARTDISYKHAPVELAQAESLEELAKWWVGYWFRKLSMHVFLLRDIKKLVKNIAKNQDLYRVSCFTIYYTIIYV